MKRFTVLLGIALALALLASSPIYGQASSGADKNFTGKLIKIDTQAKIVAVQDPDGKEMSFNYNDDTTIIGPDKTAQGLTGRAGSRVLITYHEERGTNLITRIELITVGVPPR